MSYASNGGRLLGHGWMSEGTTVTSASLNSTTAAVGCIFQMPVADTITDLVFRYNSRTGTPPTYRASLQALDSSGFPDGTALASITFTPPASTAWNATEQTVTFSSGYAVTAGQMISAVIDYSSGTVNTSNFGSFSYGHAYRSGSEFPYPVSKTTGAYTKATQFPIFGLKSASAVYGLPILGVYTTNTAATAGHRQGVRFTVPSTSCYSVGIKGLNAFCQYPAATGATWTLKLFDTDNSTVLLSKQFDADALVSRAGIGIFCFDDEYEVLAGNTHNLVLEVDATTASWAVGMRALQFNSAGDSLCLPYPGTMVHAAYDGSTWTYTDTLVPIAELVLGTITPSSGGGGGNTYSRGRLVNMGA